MAVQDEAGHTPLHLAALNNDNPAVVEALLAVGADPNTPTLAGHTAPYRAAFNADYAVFTILETRGILAVTT